MTYLRNFIDDPEITATPVNNVTVGNRAINSKIPDGTTVNSISGTTITLSASTTGALNQNEIIIFSSTPVNKTIGTTQGDDRYNLIVPDTTDLSVNQMVTNSKVTPGTFVRGITPISGGSTALIRLSAPTTSKIQSGETVTFTTVVSRKTVATAQSTTGASFISSNINFFEINGNSAIINLNQNSISTQTFTFTGTQTFSNGIKNLGTFTLPVRPITGSTTLTTSDSVIYYTGSANGNINLPSSTPSANIFFIIVNRSSATLTLIAPSAGNGTINNANTDISIATNTSIRLQHRGSNNWTTI